jgi:nucleotide sugar dehydrogenase
MLIGMIGNGFVGKAYADYYESTGHTVVRYSLEEDYIDNASKIAHCDLVIVAVPTPTTPEGPDYSIVESVINLAGQQKIVVIKSTVEAGFTEKVSGRHLDKIILHSPEFLREKTAAQDVLSPDRVIIGVPVSDDRHLAAATMYMQTLPAAKNTIICSSRASEFAKYAGNLFLAMKVVFSNAMYDLSNARGIEYAEVKAIIAADSRIGGSHLSIWQDGGRGAGGNCFIKDMAAFRQKFATFSSNEAIAFIDSIIAMNRKLLSDSGKDTHLLKQVFNE